MRTVIQELGLPDGATEADVLAADLNLKNRVGELENIQAEAPPAVALESQPEDKQVVTSEVNPS